MPEDTDEPPGKVEGNEARLDVSAEDSRQSATSSRNPTPPLTGSDKTSVANIADLDGDEDSDTGGR